MDAPRLGGLRRQLAGVALIDKGQVGGDELPFLVANIAVIGLSSSVQALKYEQIETKVRNTL